MKPGVHVYSNDFPRAQDFARATNYLLRMSDIAHAVANDTATAADLFTIPEDCSILWRKLSILWCRPWNSSNFQHSPMGGGGSSWPGDIRTASRNCKGLFHAGHLYPNHKLRYWEWVISLALWRNIPQLTVIYSSAICNPCRTLRSNNSALCCPWTTKHPLQCFPSWPIDLQTQNRLTMISLWILCLPHIQSV